MKTYVIRRTPGGTVTCHVRQDDGTTQPLRHLIRHSPTGFEVGYHGSGPADLARSIVGDFLGDPDPHPIAYQAVKAAFIAPLDRDSPGPFELTGRQLLDFLKPVAAAIPGRDAI